MHLSLNIPYISKVWVYVTLEHKTSHKGTFFEIDI